MIKNYLTIALRNVWRNKGYSFINIFGLATGMAVAILIGLWVQRELNYDGFNENKKNIGRIMKRTFFNDEKGTQNGISLPLYDELKANYPEVKHITRLDWGSTHALVVGEKKLKSRGHFADPDFLRMFSFPLITGSLNSVLKDPNSIVLTKSLASALFDKEDPVGKMIKMNNRRDLMVTGILKDVPKNSSITFEFLVPYELSAQENKAAKTQWSNNFLQNLVELNDGTSMDKFSKRIEHIIQQKSGEKTEGTLFIHPLEKWHLYSDFKEWANVGGAIEYVRLFSVIGLLVLVIACINFMNLSTARSEKRAREVGIRKAIGSKRKQLIVQFLGESMLTTSIAFLISLLIVVLTLPFLTNVGFQDISFDFNNYTLISVAFLGCIITGLFAGSYPALYLSGFTPVKVLKGTFQPGKSADLPRKILVVTQFSFSIALIIGTIIVFQQIQHAKNRPLGYNPNNMIAFGLSGDLKDHYDALKHDLLSSGYVASMSKSSSPMTGVYNQWDNFSWEGKDPNSKPLFSTIMVDADYAKTAGIKLREGRFFSEEFGADSSAIVLNESAVKLMGLRNPIGSLIQSGKKTLTVIGVTDDVLMQNPFDPVVPAVMLNLDWFIGQAMIRFKEGVDLQKALAAIKPVIEKHSPAEPFTYRFVDEEFDKKFIREAQIGSLSRIFAVLAIAISCLGLFGLASFMAERRTKEIGVRKVLGASVSQLWVLLSKDFLLLIFISCLIASPIAFYFLQEWLQKYQYHISISPFVFIGAAVLAIGITLITVSFQVIKAALANPVKSLRSE